MSGIHVSLLHHCAPTEHSNCTQQERLHQCFYIPMSNMVSNGSCVRLSLLHVLAPLAADTASAPAGAQAVASDSTNGYSGGATAFASASARFTVVRQCLLNATIQASAAASTAVSTAQTAISSSNATAATSVIQNNICNPVTASAVAQAFAEAIATGTGCNGAVYTAISSKTFCSFLVLNLLSVTCTVMHNACSHLRAVSCFLVHCHVLFWPHLYLPVHCTHGQGVLLLESLTTGTFTCRAK